MFTQIKKLCKNSFDLLFPARCFLCNSITAETGLCVDCWQEINFISPPYCKKCGHPFDVEIDKNVLCGNCISSPPPYKQAFGLFKYDEHSRKIIHKIKYSDKTNFIPYFTNILSFGAKEIIGKVDIILAVPMHRLKYLSRKYNQSQLIAYNLAKQNRKLYYPDLIIKAKVNKPQSGLSKKERKANVAGVFAVKEKYRATMKGRKLLLIDDVMTTGETINACTKLLLKKGCKSVYVLTLARTAID
jgi:ComF family protein